MAYQCDKCGGSDLYMVKSHVWAAAGLTYTQNVCRSCLANILERDLIASDFTEAPVNWNIFPETMQRWIEIEGARGCTN